MGEKIEVLERDRWEGIERERERRKAKWNMEKEDAKDIGKHRYTPFPPFLSSPRRIIP